VPRAPPSGRLVGVQPTHHRRVESPRALCAACFATLPQGAAPPRASQARSPRGAPFDLVGSVPLSTCHVAVTRASVGVCGHRMPPLHSPPRWRALASVRSVLPWGADASPTTRRAASLASCVGYCRTLPLAALPTVPGALAPATLVRHVAVASVGRYRCPVGRCRRPHGYAAYACYHHATVASLRRSSPRRRILNRPCSTSRHCCGGLPFSTA
jgi:hypothetical protein